MAIKIQKTRSRSRNLGRSDSRGKKSVLKMLGKKAKLNHVEQFDVVASFVADLPSGNFTIRQNPPI